MEDEIIEVKREIQLLRRDLQMIKMDLSKYLEALIENTRIKTITANEPQPPYWKT